MNRAIEIVQRGLEHHPDYIDAQLYLVELLHESGEMDAAQERAQLIFSKLLESDKFWVCLREHLLSSHKHELGLAAFVIERNSLGRDVDLGRLLISGIDHYVDDCAEIPVVSEPEADLDAEEVAQICINSGIKTKTMAKLLVAQGEYGQAIRIYDDLLLAVTTDEDRSELEALRGAACKEIAGKTLRADDNESKLYRVLNSLAERLEERNFRPI